MSQTAEQEYMERLTQAVNNSVDFNQEFKSDLHQFKLEQFYEMFAQEILFYKPIELLNGQVWGEGILVTYDADDMKKLHHSRILIPDQPVELINGHFFKTPISTQAQTNAAIDLSTEMLRGLGDNAISRGGYDIELGAKFVVSPEIAILQAPRERYNHRNATLGDVYLLVEVLAEKPKYWDYKLSAYARACVPELWVLNTSTQQLEIYADSDGVEFLHQVKLEKGQPATPLEFPDVQIRWW